MREREPPLLFPLFNIPATNNVVVKSEELDVDAEESVDLGASVDKIIASAIGFLTKN